MKCDEVLDLIKSIPNPKPKEWLKRSKINVEKAYGTRLPDIQNLAKKLGTDHELSKQLWKTEFREARLLASFLADPKLVDEEMMEEWVLAINSWDICDCLMKRLFVRTNYAWSKAVEWCKREEEFVKRSGFVLMIELALKDKKANDSDFDIFWPIVKREAYDDRNFVKKAVNWAIRQIGKRNKTLNRAAIKVAEEISNYDSKSAKWIAKDALRELKSEPVQNRLKKK